MGREPTTRQLRPEEIRAFTKGLLTDLEALESMLRRGMFETGIRRIGAEQELFLIDRSGRPAPISTELLEELDGDEFTTELARFNLEINLPPIEMASGCFNELEEQVTRLVASVRERARDHDAEVLLAGILPTLIPSDVTLENMTPRERFRALNNVLAQLSGGSYRLHIEGADELNFVADSVMLEGCNTSFQVHLQVEPDEFAKLYNVAQAITSPVLAACVNSPLLFGRRLWAETRIALFQQSIDTRRTTPHLREVTRRVRFGERWVDRSVLDVFREDIARIPALLAAERPTDPFAELKRGAIPTLQALQLYNSTVYRWNRPCYGITNGRPHLRIECRVLPSGPTIVDEVANAALWIGSVLGPPRSTGMSESASVSATFAPTSWPPPGGASSPASPGSMDGSSVLHGSFSMSCCQSRDADWNEREYPPSRSTGTSASSKLASTDGAPEPAGSATRWRRWAARARRSSEWPPSRSAPCTGNWRASRATYGMWHKSTKRVAGATIMPASSSS